ncbi:hypothetical protein [Acinetobacter sp. ANC 4648]|uniref:hypothetical protein n=1 Tax=Acinetobacter sp. ANC 4648 TaxID=1977875 RepID=UPI000A335F7C|nr:hypothetical protein [Acinetobacter sp. ANC 4648]OTG81570.1 hypothetical protein B9T27_09845 [Acinetobacter sp. ANC 4648]
MRYKIIDVYLQQNVKRYIAKCLKPQSPQFIVIESSRTLCKELDIIDVDHQSAQATWATGEKIALCILASSDSFDKIYTLDA